MLVLPRAPGDLRSVHAGCGRALDHSPGGVFCILYAVTRHHHHDDVAAADGDGLRGAAPRHGPGVDCLFSGPRVRSADGRLARYAVRRQGRIPGGDRDIPARLAGVRGCRPLRLLHRCPGAAGAGRRRDEPGRTDHRATDHAQVRAAGGQQRHHLARADRPVGRPGDRRLRHRPLRLALELSPQPTHRPPVHGAGAEVRPFLPAGSCFTPGSQGVLAFLDVAWGTLVRPRRDLRRCAWRRRLRGACLGNRGRGPGLAPSAGRRPSRPSAVGVADSLVPPGLSDRGHGDQGGDFVGSVLVAHPVAVGVRPRGIASGRVPVCVFRRQLPGHLPGFSRLAVLWLSQVDAGQPHPGRRQHRRHGLHRPRGAPGLGVGLALRGGRHSFVSVFQPKLVDRGRDTARAQRRCVHPRQHLPASFLIAERGPRDRHAEWRHVACRRGHTQPHGLPRDIRRDGDPVGGCGLVLPRVASGSRG